MVVSIGVLRGVMSVTAGVATHMDIDSLKYRRLVYANFAGRFHNRIAYRSYCWYYCNCIQLVRVALPKER